MGELYQRKCHVDFWQEHKGDLAADCRCIVVVGTPGIGKSVSLNFLLLQYLQAAD